jgi:hypothetical protein
MAATEHENRLTICNRALLENLQQAKRLGDQLAAMLRTAAPDWREAMAAIARWESQQ